MSLFSFLIEKKKEQNDELEEKEIALFTYHREIEVIKTVIPFNTDVPICLSMSINQFYAQPGHHIVQG